MSIPNTPESLATRVRGSDCPLCGKPSTAVAAPFCSPGCRDRDLIAWLGDGYRVPGPPVDDETISGESGLGGQGSSGLDRDG